MKFINLVIISNLLLASFANSADSIKVHAIHKENFSCTDHWEGQFKYVGDALGTDCIISGWYQDDKRLFQRTYINDGFNNEDWFGFNKAVLSPCDCTVTAIHINKKTNVPGVMQPGRASSISFKAKDGATVLLAHVRQINVKVGDFVKRGSPVAKVGNNGYSRNPHIHIGAWDSQGTPLQIQFDQSTLSLLDRK